MSSLIRAPANGDFLDAGTYRALSIGQRLKDLNLTDDVRFVGNALDERDLENPAIGSVLIGWLRNVSGSKATNVAKWLGWQSPSFFDWMTDAEITDVQAGTKMLDVSTAVQRAITETEGKKSVFMLEQPAGMYRCDAQLTIGKPMNILGFGVSAHGVPNDKTPTGSLFYFNHSDVGITIRRPGGGNMGGICLSKSGSMRPQPLELPGWVPTAHNFDIHAESAHVEIDDFTFVNPTRAMDFFSLEYGRLNMNNIKGQPMEVGVQVVASADVVRLTNFHLWPFFQNNDYVDDYTRNNLEAIILYKCDNPILTNIFTIFAKSSLTLAQNQYGTVSKLHLSNADFDRGKRGITIDQSVTSGVSGQIDNLTIQGEEGLSNTENIVINGNNSVLQFGSVYTNTAKGRALAVSGTGNRLDIANLRCAQWGLGNSGVAAVDVEAGNIVHIANKPTMYSTDSAINYGGSGEISLPLGEGVTNEVTDVNGEINVFHGFETTPTIVTTQIMSEAALTIIVKNLSSTNFTARIYSTVSGMPLALTPVLFSWSGKR